MPTTLILNYSSTPADSTCQSTEEILGLQILMLLQISLLLQASENSYKEAAEVLKSTLQLKVVPQNCPTTYRNDKLSTHYC